MATCEGRFIDEIASGTAVRGHSKCLCLLAAVTVGSLFNINLFPGNVSKIVESENSRRKKVSLCPPCTLCLPSISLHASIHISICPPFSDSVPCLSLYPSISQYAHPISQCPPAADQALTSMTVSLYFSLCPISLRALALTVLHISELSRSLSMPSDF